VSPVTYQCHPTGTVETLDSDPGAPPVLRVYSIRRSPAAVAYALLCCPSNAKVGVNYGESRDAPWGVYHSLTESFTLLAELTDTDSEAHNGVENDSSNLNVDA
jgi:hypothetical protein